MSRHLQYAVAGASILPIHGCFFGGAGAPCGCEPQVRWVVCVLWRGTVAVRWRGAGGGVWAVGCADAAPRCGRLGASMRRGVVECVGVCAANSWGAPGAAGGARSGRMRFADVSLLPAA
mgnify:CR=1 FL=1